MFWFTRTPSRAICPHCGCIVTADAGIFTCPACHHRWAHTPYLP